MAHPHIHPLNSHGRRQKGQHVHLPPLLICVLLLAAGKTMAEPPKKEKTLAEQYNLTLVTPENHPAYSAILNIYDKQRDGDTQLWAIKPCLAAGPRHAVATRGVENSQIIGKQFEAYVGYKDAKTGFTSKSNLAPVICGKNNHSEGNSEEDICIYRSTENFPSSVQPIKVADIDAATIDTLGKDGVLEGVGFTDESIQLANHTFGLGRSNVKTTSDYTYAQIVGTVYIGNSGSGVLFNDKKTNAKYLVGYKVGQSNVVTGYQIMALYRELKAKNPQAVTCQ